jgi:electron transfer flavoprotein alpha/beta subunit
MDIYPHTNIDDIEPDTNKITVPRKLEKGDCEMIECSLSALLTVESGLNIPTNQASEGF